jgi:hypothetical protein
MDLQHSRKESGPPGRYNRASTARTPWRWYPASSITMSLLVSAVSVVISILSDRLPRRFESVGELHRQRAIATDYVRSAGAPDAPALAPYPVQRGLTAAMRDAAGKSRDVHRMQAWAGQAAALARAEPAG